MAKSDPFNLPVEAVARVRTGDSASDRFQDQLLGTLNPFLRRLSGVVNVVPQIDSKSLPKAGAKYSGRLIRVKDDRRPEEIYVCLTKSDGSYEWVRIATASS